MGAILLLCLTLLIIWCEATIFIYSYMGLDLSPFSKAIRAVADSQFAVYFMVLPPLVGGCVWGVCVGGGTSSLLSTSWCCAAGVFVVGGVHSQFAIYFIVLPPLVCLWWGGVVEGWGGSVGAHNQFAVFYMGALLPGI